MKLFAVALVLAAASAGLVWWVSDSVSDPGATLGLEEFAPLPESVVVGDQDLLPCRASGRQGFMFRDVAVSQVDGQDAVQTLSLWLLGDGMKLSAPTGEVALRFGDDSRIAAVWRFEDYRELARPVSQAIVAAQPQPDAVIRFWPADTACET